MSQFLDYDIVDVFTDRAFAGNPLAVVHGTGGCSDSELLAIAREFNLSETAFPWPVSDGVDASYRLRICTPAVELPFAGHPSVGAAWVLRQRGVVSFGTVIQECGAGLLPLVITEDSVTLTGGTPVVGSVSAAEVASAIGLSAADLLYPPMRCGMGLEFACCIVADGVVDTCQPSPALLAALGGGGVSVSSFADGRAYTRVFAGGVGVDEDPATGSAALGFGAYLAALGLVPGDGVAPYLISQGVLMGRPSILRGMVTAASGAAVSGTVAGGVVQVASGTIRRP